MADDVTGLSRRSFLTGRMPPPAAEAGAAAPLIAGIGAGCLAAAGVDCQLCRDACAEDAIAFRPRRGGPFLPSIRASLCTGCADCLAVCPTAAIQLVPAPDAAQEAARGAAHG